MAAAQRKPVQHDPVQHDTVQHDTVEARLLDGHYDRALEAFQAQIEDAAATLRRAHAALKAENTLRS